MNLAESEFQSYIHAKKKGCDYLYGGLTPVVKEIDSGGYSLSVHCSDIEVTLSSARKSVRRFGSIDSAADYLRRMDIYCFECMVNKSV
jgi:hypothetical protein